MQCLHNSNCARKTVLQHKNNIPARQYTGSKTKSHHGGALNLPAQTMLQQSHGPIGFAACTSGPRRTVFSVESFEVTVRGLAKQRCDTSEPGTGQ